MEKPPNSEAEPSGNLDNTTDHYRQWSPTRQKKDEEPCQKGASVVYVIQVVSCCAPVGSIVDSGINCYDEYIHSTIFILHVE